MVLGEITVTQETLCVQQFSEGKRKFLFSPERFLAATEKLRLIQKRSLRKYKKQAFCRIFKEAEFFSS